MTGPAWRGEEPDGRGSATPAPGDVLDATEGDLYAVKELLGHSSTRVTEVYLHSSRTRTESAVRALTEYRRANRQTEAD